MIWEGNSFKAKVLTDIMVLKLKLIKKRVILHIDTRKIAADVSIIKNVCIFSIMRMYILCIKYRIFATLIWTKACSFITSLCIFPFITPFITPSRNTCAHFIQSALDLFLDAYPQFELWKYDLNIMYKYAVLSLAYYD